VSRIEFFRRSCIFVGIVLVPLLVWFFFDLVLIVLGAVLMAELLWAIATPFMRALRLPKALGLGLAAILILGVIAAAAYLFGTQIGAEWQDVLARADAALQAIVGWLEGSPIGKMILSRVQGADFSVTSLAGSIFGVSLRSIEALVVTVIVGLYLAAEPTLYRRGLAMLFPGRWRRSANATFDEIATALRLWLIGQLGQMVVVGLLATAATWLIGLPSPAALGIIAGLAEFVPYIGPLLAAIPALLVAGTNGLDAVIWTAVAYLAIHQLEGNLIVPLIQRQMIAIPPAVMLLGIVTITFIFGHVALIFAAPITIILFVAIKKLYVRDTLGEKTTLPSERR